jgi:hypothetical protein
MRLRCGFAEMLAKGESDAALSRFDGNDLYSRSLTVNAAKPHEDRGGFGGGKRGGGNSRY